MTTAKVQPEALAPAPEAESIVKVFSDYEEYRKAFVFVALKTNSQYGFPGTDGTKKGNLMKFILQNHPFISMFCAHEMQPFSKGERACIIFIQLTFQLFISALMAGLSRPKCDCGYVDPSDDRLDDDFANANTNVTVNYCQTKDLGSVCGDNEGNYYCEYDCDTCGNCDDGEDVGTAIVSIIFSSLASILVYLLKFAATCGCVQNCNGCIRGCFEKIGSCIVCVFIIVAIFFLILALVLAPNSAFVVNWIISVFVAWLQWPLYTIPLYFWKFNKKKAKFQEKFGKEFHSIKFQNASNYGVVTQGAQLQQGVEMVTKPNEMNVEDVETVNQNPLQNESANENA